MTTDEILEKYQDVDDIACCQALAEALTAACRAKDAAIVRLFEQVALLTASHDMYGEIKAFVKHIIWAASDDMKGKRGYTPMSPEQLEVAVGILGAMEEIERQIADPSKAHIGHD
jgi:hypothetical protein